MGFVEGRQKNWEGTEGNRELRGQLKAAKLVDGRRFPFDHVEYRHISRNSSNTPNQNTSRRHTCTEEYKGRHWQEKGSSHVTSHASQALPQLYRRSSGSSRRSHSQQLLELFRYNRSSSLFSPSNPSHTPRLLRLFRIPLHSTPLLSTPCPRRLSLASRGRGSSPPPDRPSAPPRCSSECP